MKRTFLAGAMIAVLTAGAANAQIVDQLKNKAKDKAKGKATEIVKGTDFTLPRPDAEPENGTAAGCILSQTYNTQSVNDFSVQFRINTSSGPEFFNVTGTHIKHDDPSSFSLATAAETLKWTRLLDTFERAAASDRPVTIHYEVASRNVFGITIDWNRKCVS